MLRKQVQLQQSETHIMREGYVGRKRDSTCLLIDRTSGVDVRNSMCL